MRELAGKTAFVTGGASGIGLGLARACLAEGMRVAIADVRPDALERAMATLDNQHVIAVELDVASRDGFAAAAADVEARLGPVSLLFNNAGINLFRTIDESSYDDWDWLLGVNLHGVINGVATFAPAMKARGEGHIVNTASMAGFIASPMPGIYNTTKFAVRGMSESLRYSLAPFGVGVSVLMPGLVRSDIYKSDEIRPEALQANANPTDPAFVARLAQVHQVGMEPDEVAEKVLAAVKDDRFWIFSHPEFKSELREIFDDILAAYPDGEGDPQRMGFEQARRDNYRKLRGTWGG